MKLTKPLGPWSYELSDNCGLEYVGSIKPMNDAEKVEHLENWIKAVINECDYVGGNPILDKAKISSVKHGLEQALKYDNRNIIVRWKP